VAIKVYEYQKCSTCQKALKFLAPLVADHDLEIQRLPIIDEPPSEKELQQMLGFLKARGGSFKNLFNTSGEKYRELKISDQIKAGMTEKEALKLLASNGRLIKRPFLLTAQDGAVGFKQDEWKQVLAKVRP
jgi:arsenate reductase (glutaredoxin)